jgi:hypothetical protein
LPVRSRRPEIRRGIDTATLAALIFGILFAAGCGYHVAGRAAQLPSEWQTIAVPAFVNNTTRYRIEQRFTQAVIREFITRTKYRVIQDQGSADAVLHGTVLSIETTPVLFDAKSGEVTTMLVTVHTKVELLESSTKKSVYKNDDMVFGEQYQISADVRSFFEEGDPALERMSRDFASKLVANVVEKF